jgi:hypothetical protein
MLFVSSFLTRVPSAVVDGTHLGEVYVPRACVGALKVPHEDLLQVCPILDGVGREVV